MFKPSLALLSCLLCAPLLPGLQSASAQTPASPPHVLMISIDGMRPDYVTQADAHGLSVPVLRSFMAHGMYADGVIGVVPTITFPSHATLVTGVWPGRHGIYNNLFFDPLNQTGGSWYWYEDDLKAPTLWQVAAKAGIVTASVFWPSTTDAGDIDYLVPAYPARFPEEAHLMEALSRPDGYLKKIEKQAGAFYIHGTDLDVDELLTKTSIAIIHDAKPGFMTVHLVSVDYYEHETAPFSPASDHAVEESDRMIGQMADAERAVDPRAIVVVVSDHGFAATHTSVNLMIPFVRAGLITLQPSSPGSRPSIAAWKAMVWNAGGSAYVILNDPKDQQTLNQVKMILEGLRDDPRYGIDRILTHDAIVARGGDPNASFLVAFHPGFSSGGKLVGGMLNAIPGTGNHGYLPDYPQLQSSFFATGSGIKHCDVGTIDMRQIAPTVAAWMGVSLPDATQPPVRCRP